VAIFPSGVPVEKVKEAAEALATNMRRASAPMVFCLIDFIYLIVGSELWFNISCRVIEIGVRPGA
jgi:hypothetical protein